MYTVTHFHNNPKSNSKHEFDNLDEAVKELESYTADNGNECSYLECSNGDWAKYVWSTQKTEWHKTKNAASALRSIPSEKRSEQSRLNGQRGGRPTQTQPTPREPDKN